MAFRARTFWMPLLPLVLALIGLMGMSGCGGRESVEDAPALLGSSIPAAAPSAEGVDLPSALVRGPGSPTRSKPPPPIKVDPFGTPAPTPVPPAGSSPGGVEL